ncbi:MAG TPA: PLP-dependent aminotransferase family protein [Dehalococcoidia bacterium]|nr:PLP-dependent aminotransferase family protein [Dehalococcoidia bacterium]
MRRTRTVIDSDRLTRLLGHWLLGNGPLYRQLAEALRDLVCRGELPVQTCLPPERALAGVLAVSRSTVVASYALLREEGWLESRQGSGTYVCRQPADSATGTIHHPRLLGLGRNPVFRGLSEQPATTIDFSVAAPPASPLVAGAIQRLSDALTRELLAGHGYAPSGIEPLRAAVAARFAACGLPTRPEQILITSGVQQALSLLCTLYLQPGDTAVVESPTYPGALEALRAAGAHVLSLPLDAGGARLDVLEELLARGGVRLVYLTPTFNNPTGAVMSHLRRRRLAQMVRQAQVPLIEDTVLAEISFGDGAMPPHVASLDEDSPIVTVGSASKTFWGGLRIGWIRASTHVIARLVGLKAAADLGCSVLSQLAAAQLVPHTAEAASGRREELSVRLEALGGSLHRFVPEWQWQEPAGGLSLWVRLPAGDAAGFAQVCERFGVTIVPGPVFAADGVHRDCLRLPFTLPPELLQEGVRRMAAAWRGYVPAASVLPARQAVV